MVFKSFRVNCVIRILMISITFWVLVYLFFQTSFYAATLIVSLTAVYQIYSLIHYVEKTNRDLTRFLDAIKYSDFSQSFTGAGLGSSFDDLKKAFSEVLVRFHHARAEKEEHFRYLQTVVQHVGVGLVAFSREGDVELINTTAKRLLKVPFLRKVQALDRVNPNLARDLIAMRPGEKKLVRITDENEILQLVVYATEFKLRNQHFTLISLQNIQSELEEKEMDAWQNLIRVLTHEIMNSVTPIASLAGTANDLLRTAQAVAPAGAETGTPDENIDDISGALKTIESRSLGLIRFVESYRNLTRIPKPAFQLIRLADLFDEIRRLMQARLKEAGAEFYVEITPSSLELTADPELLEQILINLIVNASQAGEGQPGLTITLRAGIDARSRVRIEVEDNGPGILEDVQAKIFIPFFTTKRGGSGIGLSLSRQIMRLHGGAISVNSRPGEKTVFSLRF